MATGGPNIVSLPEGVGGWVPLFHGRHVMFVSTITLSIVAVPGQSFLAAQAAKDQQV